MLSCRYEDSIIYYLGASRQRHSLIKYNSTLLSGRQEWSRHAHSLQTSSDKGSSVQRDTSMTAVGLRHISLQYFNAILVLELSLQPPPLKICIVKMINKKK